MTDANRHDSEDRISNSPISEGTSLSVLQKKPCEQPPTNLSLDVRTGRSIEYRYLVPVVSRFCNWNEANPVPVVAKHPAIDE